MYMHHGSGGAPQPPPNWQQQQPPPPPNPNAAAANPHLRQRLMFPAVPGQGHLRQQFQSGYPNPAHAHTTAPNGYGAPQPAPAPQPPAPPQYGSNSGQNPPNPYPYNPGHSGPYGQQYPQTPLVPPPPPGMPPPPMNNQPPAAMPPPPMNNQPPAAMPPMAPGGAQGHGHVSPNNSRPGYPGPGGQQQQQQNPPQGYNTLSPPPGPYPPRQHNSLPGVTQPYQAAMAPAPPAQGYPFPPYNPQGSGQQPPNPYNSQSAQQQPPYPYGSQPGQQQQAAAAAPPPPPPQQAQPPPQPQPPPFAAEPPPNFPKHNGQYYGDIYAAQPQAQSTASSIMPTEEPPRQENSAPPPGAPPPPVPQTGYSQYPQHSSQQAQQAAPPQTYGAAPPPHPARPQPPPEASSSSNPHRRPATAMPGAYNMHQQQQQHPQQLFSGSSDPRVKLDACKRKLQQMIAALDRHIEDVMRTNPNSRSVIPRDKKMKLRAQKLMRDVDLLRMLTNMHGQGHEDHLQTIILRFETSVMYCIGARNFENKRKNYSDLSILEGDLDRILNARQLFEVDDARRTHRHILELRIKANNLRHQISKGPRNPTELTTDANGQSTTYSEKRINELCRRIDYHLETEVKTSLEELEMAFGNSDGERSLMSVFRGAWPDKAADFVAMEPPPLPENLQSASALPPPPQC